jgi:transcriptional regulator with XRE-family HTH domain
MSTWMQNKRKIIGLSQTQVAESIGVSRPTYEKMETGKLQPTEEQKSILMRVFDVNEEDTSLDIKIIKNTDILSDEVSIRNIPVENTEKFKQVLLYILNKIGGRPNIGQTVLYKLLYFIDFDYYEKYEEQLIGATYIKNNFGPTPVSFAKIVKDLERKGLLVTVKSKYFDKDQTRYIAVQEVDLIGLNGRELKHIDDEIARLGHMSAGQISDLSHKDTPWRIAKDREVLNYEYVYYRPEETSVREYEAL